MRRVIFGAVAIPAVFVVVYLGGWALVIVLALVAALGASELYDLALRRGVDPLRRTGVVSAAAVPAVVYLGLSGGAGARWGWTVAGLWMALVLTVALARRAASQRPLAATAVTVFGTLYPSALAASLITIRHGAHGTMSWAGAGLALFPLVIAWVCDTAAMAGGRALGGPKLWPAISPEKTLSGSVAGVLGALAAVPLLNALVLADLGVALPLWQGLCFALVLSIVGQLGDLAESLFKREAGVKDSSSLIPGHGGVLDRVDSLCFILPAAAALYRLFGVL